MSAGERYTAAMHRLQTIVKFQLEMAGYASRPGQVVPDQHVASPKHLRVGVESALASAESIAALLIERGVFTAEEYTEQLAHDMEARADDHELRVRTAWPNVRFQ